MGLYLCPITIFFVCERLKLLNFILSRVDEQRLLIADRSNINFGIVRAPYHQVKNRFKNYLLKTNAQKSTTKINYSFRKCDSESKNNRLYDLIDFICVTN